LLKKIKQQLFWVLVIFVVVSAIEVINLVSGRALNQFGILPHHLNGLVGIVISPFLHGSFWHYLSNIVPLCIFSFFILQYGSKNYFTITGLLIAGTGLLVWLLGRSALHIGASSLIYGYFGFLVLAGWRSMRWQLVLISVAVAVFYGGLVFGVLPTRYYISWEAHLFGLLTGLALAKVWRFPKG
jgi:membrane associated rhomboid family serine protease